MGPMKLARSAALIGVCLLIGGLLPYPISAQIPVPDVNQVIELADLAFLLWQTTTAAMIIGCALLKADKTARPREDGRHHSTAAVAIGGQQILHGGDGVRLGNGKGGIG